MIKIDDIAKNFIPQEREPELYEHWLKQGNFQARAESGKKPYTIVMPPPNITGQLHIGHALDMSCQDILIRYKRMKGYEALYLPGTDHAAIATEAKIVEKLRQEGKSKEALGRDGFLTEAWAWKQKYNDRICAQIKRMGVSCDWSRLRFTMDEGLSEAVRQIFVKLYRKGLIYRGERIVNWCPHCHTSISDAEVDYREEAGHFWHLRYPLADGSAYLELATTRPETLLGDTAVAVHPDDERYQDLIGKTLILPLVGREIPIVADHYVDREFGTGVVKITPAHDPNDFEVGLRHQLPVINVMDDNAVMNEEAGVYQGLSREACRKRIVQDLEAGGFLVRTEDIKHNVGACYRCSTSIEPRVSLQWFVKMKDMADAAIAAVRQGDSRFIPERFEKIYFHWMENIRDWCISRQLWWGHRIPAWYCEDCGEITVSETEPKCCEHCGSEHLHQDEDTLDTWFSSALWPFSTLGWPEQTEDLKAFYPTDCLVTGYDIITFWVSRMIFSALEHTGQAPFKDIYIHGLVRDAEGRKMSKSLGNGIDPLEVIDQFGADALRFALMTGTSPGNDTRYTEAKVEAGRNFINKIWNAYRFCVMNFDDDMPRTLPVEELEEADRWILSELQDLIREVSQNFEQYELGIALGKIYNFIWDLFCDWYIEFVKPRLRQTGSRTRQVAQICLHEVLEQTLRLLHPFMPFLTEEIHRGLRFDETDLMMEAWPSFDEKLYFAAEREALNYLRELIRSIRNARAELNVPAKQEARILLSLEQPELCSFLAASEAQLKHLAQVSKIDFIKDEREIPEMAMALAQSVGCCYLPLEDLIDIEAECTRLGDELQKYQLEIEKTEAKLANESFTARAPENVVQKERDKLQRLREMAKTSEARLKQLRP